jgi:hypothetical protein
MPLLALWMGLLPQTRTQLKAKVVEASTEDVGGSKYISRP